MFNYSEIKASYFWIVQLNSTIIYLDTIVTTKSSWLLSAHGIIPNLRVLDEKKKKNTPESKTGSITKVNALNTEIKINNVFSIPN